MDRIGCAVIAENGKEKRKGEKRRGKRRAGEQKGEERIQISMKKVEDMHTIWYGKEMESRDEEREANARENPTDKQEENLLYKKSNEQIWRIEQLACDVSNRKRRKEKRTGQKPSKESRERRAEVAQKKERREEGAGRSQKRQFGDTPLTSIKADKQRTALRTTACLSFTQLPSLHDEKNLCSPVIPLI